MKNLKKTLSMVLVIAMMLSILVIGAGAAFTDDEDINYTTAVEVMTGIGAINGFPDGTFKPQDPITRAEAAKMVAYAILTPQVAQMLPKTTSSFSDVASTNWASPFIEYCVSKGIINGVGGGKFDPSGNVTGYQIGKMMLCAAGYGKNNEYVGANWELNAAIDAMDKGIFTGSLDADLSDAATREEAALYVFNAITNAKMQQVVFNTTTEAYEPTAAKKTIGEQKYGLFMDPVNMNGVSGYVWKNMFNTILCSIVYTDNVLGTSTNGTTITNLATSYNPFYIAKLDTVVSYYYNGKDYTMYTGADDAAKKAAVKTAAETAAAKKGVVVNFIDTDFNGKADKVTVIEKTVFTLLSTPSVNATTGAVTIVGLNGSAAIAEEFIDYPADLVKGDVILYYIDSVGVFNIEKAEKVTGQITGANSYSATVTFGGTTYRQSGLVTNVLFNSGNGFAEKQENHNVNATAYLDDNGDIVAIKADDVVVNYIYGLVVGYEYTPAAPSGLTPAMAKVRLYTVDGKVAVYDVAPNAYGVVPNQGHTIGTDTGTGEFDFNTSGHPYGYLCTYTINETTGKVTLVKATANVTNGTLGSAYTAKGTLVSLSGGSNYYVTSNTKVIYFDTSKAYEAMGANKNTASIVTGYGSTLAAISGMSVQYVLVPGTNYLSAILFAQDGTAATVATNYGYVINPGPTTSFAGSYPIYTYNVWVDGIEKEIKSYVPNVFGTTPGLYAYDLNTNDMIAAVATPVTAVVDGTVQLVEPGFVAYKDGTTNKSVGVTASTAYYLIETAIPSRVVSAGSISETNKIAYIQPSTIPGYAAAIYYTLA
jgi:hypothetical protein